MQKNDCNLTPFSTYEPQQKRRRDYESESFRTWTRRKREFQARTGSMLAKIGICIAILAAVILLQVFVLNGGQEEEPALETAGGDLSGATTEEDDVLGRLRFVSVGGVRSVFSVSQRWDLPIKDAAASLGEDDTVLTLAAKAGDVVYLPAAGEVRAIGRDDALGQYVRVSHGSELESVYYNLSDVQVEEGQPLLAKDTLGKLGEDGKLYIRLTRSGAPVNPADYLNIGA